MILLWWVLFYSRKMDSRGICDLRSSRRNLRTINRSLGSTYYVLIWEPAKRSGRKALFVLVAIFCWCKNWRHWIFTELNTMKAVLMTKWILALFILVFIYKVDKNIDFINPPYCGGRIFAEICLTILISWKRRNLFTAPTLSGIYSSILSTVNNIISKLWA